MERTEQDEQNQDMCIIVVTRGKSPRAHAHACSIFRLTRI